MQERIDLVAVAEEKRKAGGLSLAVGVSVVLHSLLIVWFVRSYRPATQTADVPIARYVELIKQNPQEFVEAPGPKTDTAPITAPLSDANRRASTPNPTGVKPTARPGDGSGRFTPAPQPGPRSEQSPSTPRASAPATQPQQQAQADAAQNEAKSDPLVYREPVAAAAPVDWRSAIRDVRKVASLGGGNGLDLGGATGGEEGTAEQGPISFETQWYDWGPYAQSMVSRIRVNWYGVMPQIIRTGISGVVTIRFTIQRDGRITDVTILKSSGVPPYDHAARKAIELSSPLNPLPKDFPNSSERVTAMFYYNKPIGE